MVLGAIIPDRLDLLDKAMTQITEGHFSDPSHRAIYKMLERYASITGAVLRRDALVDSLTNVPQAKAAVVLETYDTLDAAVHDEADFRWAIKQLRELAAEKATKEALVEAQTILTQGLDVGGTQLQGHVDARTALLSSLAQIDKDLALQDAPEGAIQDEYQQLLDDYDERKRLRMMGLGDGIRFGIPALDAVIGGYHNGELNLLAGASSSGKSSACVALAWHAAVMQGKNVVFSTTETLRPQIIRKLIARHSKMEQFGIPEGLNTRNLKDGTLSETEEIKRRDVVQDLTRNTAYGKIYVMQVPRGGSLATIESKMTHINASMFQVDLGIIDSLNLLKPGIKRMSEREEFSYILREAKSFAATFDDGRGLPVISPWQTNRSGQTLASKSGAYKTDALSDTSEAEKSSDVIVSWWADDSSKRYTDMHAQVLKNRDGEKSEPIPLNIDYATCYVTERAVARMVRNTSSAPTDLHDLFN